MEGNGYVEARTVEGVCTRSRMEETIWFSERVSTILLFSKKVWEYTKVC